MAQRPFVRLAFEDGVSGNVSRQILVDPYGCEAFCLTAVIYSRRKFRREAETLMTIRILEALDEYRLALFERSLRNKLRPFRISSRVTPKRKAPEAHNLSSVLV
jgi:hypothetical protein